MKKIFTFILFLMSFTVSSEFYYGVGYLNASSEIDDDKFSMGVVEVTLGNTIDDSFSTEMALGYGVGGDEIGSGRYAIDAEIESSFALRGIYHINDNFFVNLFWTKLNLYAEDYRGWDYSDTGKDIGIGLGVDFKMNEENNQKIRLSYDIAKCSGCDDDDNVKDHFISIKYLF